MEEPRGQWHNATSPFAACSRDAAGCSCSDGGARVVSKPALGRRMVGSPVITYKTLEDAYQLSETLGSGGFGSVIKATDKKTGKQVAVKVQKPSLLNVAWREYHFMQVAIGSEQGPACCVRPLEFFVDARSNRPCIVMELCSSCFFDWVDVYMRYHRKVAASSHNVCRQGMVWFLLLLNCVRKLHAAGLVHGDVKPENFLVDTSSHPEGLPALRLCDFGASSYSDERLGAYGYTHEYAAPELLADRSSRTQSSDLFSLGVILYQLGQGVHYIRSGGRCLPLPFGPCPTPGCRQGQPGAGPASWFQASAYAIRIRLGRITWYDTAAPEAFRQLVSGLLRGSAAERWSMERILTCDALEEEVFMLACERYPACKADLMEMLAARRALLAGAPTADPVHKLLEQVPALRLPSNGLAPSASEAARVLGPQEGSPAHPPPTPLRLSEALPSPSTPPAAVAAQHGAFQGSACTATSHPISLSAASSAGSACACASNPDSAAPSSLASSPGVSPRTPGLPPLHPHSGALGASHSGSRCRPPVLRHGPSPLGPASHAQQPQPRGPPSTGTPVPGSPAPRAPTPERHVNAVSRLRISDPASLSPTSSGASAAGAAAGAGAHVSNSQPSSPPITSGLHHHHHQHSELLLTKYAMDPAAAAITAAAGVLLTGARCSNGSANSFSSCAERQTVAGCSKCRAPMAATATTACGNELDSPSACPVVALRDASPCATAATASSGSSSSSSRSSSSGSSSRSSSSNDGSCQRCAVAASRGASKDSYKDSDSDGMSWGGRCGVWSQTSRLLGGDEEEEPQCGLDLGLSLGLGDFLTSFTRCFALGPPTVSP